MPENSAGPPHKCPVCESFNLQPSLRQNIIPVDANAKPFGVLSYRCDQGHVFMTSWPVE
jgi:hypothetical protein